MSDIIEILDLVMVFTVVVLIPFILATIISASIVCTSNWILKVFDGAYIKEDKHILFIIFCFNIPVMIFGYHYYEELFKLFI